MVDLNITLTVEASDLYSKANNPTNINEHSSLTDDNQGCAPGGNIEDFQSSVVKNQVVVWVGETTDSGYSVEIDSIALKSGTTINFFSAVLQYGGSAGKVTATVNADPDLERQIYEYTINFSIKDPNGNVKNFEIDPKLKGKPNN